MPINTKVYVGNLPDPCSMAALRTLFEKYGEVVECDVIKDYGFVHFSDSEEAKVAVKNLNESEWEGITLKVELSYSKVHPKPGMGNKGECYRCGKSGHWAKHCPSGSSRVPWGGIGFERPENRGFNFNNMPRGLGVGNLYMNGGGFSSGNFQSGGNIGLYRPNDRNGYREPYREMYREPFYSDRDDIYSGSHHYNNNTNSSGHYHHSNNNNNSSGSRELGMDPFYDSYPPPPPPPSRYRPRPYPSAYERRAPLSPMSGSEPRLPSSSPQYSNSHNNYHSPPSNNGREMDPYFRPPPEYYDRRRRVVAPNSAFIDDNEHV